VSDYFDVASANCAGFPDANHLRIFDEIRLRCATPSSLQLLSRAAVRRQLLAAANSGDPLLRRVGQLSRELPEEVRGYLLFSDLNGSNPSAFLSEAVI
jgi:hypothetical protein